MNKVVLVGRIAKEPEMRYSQSDSPMAITRYTLAVDRAFKKDGQTSADFISCVAFGKIAEVADKYYSKGMRIAVSGRIQTGSYTDKNGVKRYTTDVVIESQEFAQSKSENTEQPQSAETAAEFEQVEHEELPFN